MNIEVVTKSDLEEMRQQLLEDIKAFLKKPDAEAGEWLRSKEVRRMLNISPGTLQTLRVNGTLNATRLGSIFYYKAADIRKLLDNQK